MTKEKKVTVTLYLNKERMMHIYEYGKFELGNMCDLTPAECTIMSVLDEIYESAVEQGA